ncbi:MAG: hypothetical protein JJU11_06965 [Candidatus Sumerlaeia bacterium]|nr:hypothetical protein [Candidatus Sumerlaeia bacterium]
MREKKSVLQPSHIWRDLPVLVLAFLTLLPMSAIGQIGGQTSADGPFVLDDAEEENILAEGVERLWIPDFIWGAENPFRWVSLTDSGLSLAEGQSPIGALRYRIPSEYGFVSKGFGVPMPGVKGESSLDFPGDISSFTHLRFLTRYSPVLTNQSFMVILETYPGPNHPKLYWRYSLPSGNTFQEVKIDLRQPDIVENANGLEVEELLSQTRFLSFYYYGETGFVPRTLEVHVDDVTLEGIYNGGGDPTPTPSPTPTPNPTPTPSPNVEGNQWTIY